MDKRSAVEAGIRAVLEAVGEADGREMVGRRKPMQAPPGEESAPPECEACKAGECSDPEHASEDDLSALLSDERGG